MRHPATMAHADPPFLGGRACPWHPATMAHADPPFLGGRACHRAQMSHPYGVPPVWPLFAFFGRDPVRLEKAQRRIEQDYGPWMGPPLSYPFDHSGYYKDEMGEGLTKLIFVSAKSFPREELTGLKSYAAGFEREHSRSGDLENREVNIDPGYLAREHMVLYSWKPRAHKLSLGQGVYGDLQLLWRRESHSFYSLPWTFPDYASGPILKYLSDTREALHRESKIKLPEK